jgi:hypothetical protein
MSFSCNDGDSPLQNFDMLQTKEGYKSKYYRHTACKPTSKDDDVSVGDQHNLCTLSHRLLDCCYDGEDSFPGTKDTLLQEIHNSHHNTGEKRDNRAQAKHLVFDNDYSFSKIQWHSPIIKEFPKLHRLINFTQNTSLLH